jgi:transposase
MLSITEKHKVYCAVQAIDFRRGIDGIAALCKNQFSLDPFSGHYFIFRNRKASAIKVLAYDSQGFWLCHKRLSKGTFRHWPKFSTSLVMLSSAQLQVLLQNGNPMTLSCEPPFRPIE